MRVYREVYRDHSYHFFTEELAGALKQEPKSEGYDVSEFATKIERSVRLRMYNELGINEDQSKMKSFLEADLVSSRALLLEKFQDGEVIQAMRDELFKKLPSRFQQEGMMKNR